MAVAIASACSGVGGSSGVTATAAANETVAWVLGKLWRSLMRRAGGQSTK
jgi:hypothetical protein